MSWLATAGVLSAVATITALVNSIVNREQVVAVDAYAVVPLAIAAASSAIALAIFVLDASAAREIAAARLRSAGLREEHGTGRALTATDVGVGSSGWIEASGTESYRDARDERMPFFGDIALADEMVRRAQRQSKDVLLGTILSTGLCFALVVVFSHS